MTDEALRLHGGLGSACGHSPRSIAAKGVVSAFSCGEQSDSGDPPDRRLEARGEAARECPDPGL